MGQPERPAVIGKRYRRREWRFESFCRVSTRRVLFDRAAFNVGVILFGRAGMHTPRWPAFRRCGYAGQKLETAIAHLDQLAIEIIRRCDARRLVVLPRRWVVEGAIAWLNRCRRLAKDWETFIASSETWLVIASVRRMTRRIAKHEL